MPKIQTPIRIRIEDFGEDYKELIGKIGSTYNSFTDDVYGILSNGIDFDNLNRQLVDISVTIDSSGKVTNSPQIKSTLKTTKVRGINVVNAINLVNSNIYPISTPFISFTINNNIVTILNVAGLQSGSQYKLTLELIG